MDFQGDGLPGTGGWGKRFCQALCQRGLARPNLQAGAAKSEGLRLLSPAPPLIACVAALVGVLHDG
eukprot:9481222-Pyramimonas_sp.AAC.1